jgi:hypothetical protein
VKGVAEASNSRIGAGKKGQLARMSEEGPKQGHTDVSLGELGWQIHAQQGTVINPNQLGKDMA